jgi:biopolymer transport protein ExbB
MAGFWEQAWTMWRAGGWGMIALAANSLLLFGVGTAIWLRLWGKGYRAVPESEWRQWIARPDQRRGVIGRLLNTLLEARTLAELRRRVEELRAAEIAPFERDLRFMKVCVSAAPLLGLLGTVTGMLATFHALATGHGGQKTMDMVAGGISEALITTETGLVIALPGFFLHYYLKRERDRYDNFLTHLETTCAQFRYCSKETTA